MASSPPGRFSRTLVSILKWGLGFALLGVLALGVAVAVAMSQLPSYQQLAQRNDLGQMIRVHAANGQVILSLGPTFGEWIPYEQIPASMRAAMIAVEDRRFRSHVGVDPIGMARSVKVRVDTGHWRQGGSTITQQLARNIFLTNNKTFGRKVKEGVLALALERKFSKDQILELYLNRVYFGGGAYGIDAASRTFFGHDARHLSLAEATIIAGLVKAPSNYSPTADVDAARSRSAVVLNSMEQNGFITSEQAASAEANAARIVVQPDQKQNSIRYFTDWALPQLDTLIDETSRPIEVWTTIDTGMQGAADKAVVANAPAGAQGALVAMDRDGAVRAMIGGKDYVSSLYNRATQAQRQPGSSFKLFVYLAALESGMKPTDTIVDEPVTIDGWTPRNSTRSYAGSVTLREAFSRSINTISAKIGSQLGFSTIADMAHRFGISGQISTYPSMVLGTSEVRLLDMTRAYASVANKGIAVTPYAITKVVSGDGRLLYRKDNSDDRVLVAPWVAAEMMDLMQSAVLSGTGRAAQIGRPVAGKTGTTNSNKDGWFIGYSSGLTTGVWMGRDDNRAIPGLQGGTAPARAFHDFMVVATAKRPVEQFETQVPMPDWQLDPGEENGGGTALNPSQPLVDENGNPINVQPNDPYGQVQQVDPATGLPLDNGQRFPPGTRPAPATPATPPQQRPGQPDQNELDRIFNSPPPPRERQAPPSQPADGAEPGGY
ncbi:PBP1A family penicillin-binding protein [Sphingomonas ginkgonis]|uniref:PBP1A family penicillin-binding protein n=1 Tax=Sphingomonas ginkgonis TaxID=2315330 RepID=A0A429V747_9SPHN|nr:PBP1A family penicillin-binding protein [Sphingomonas ginkgonis]RST29768.1 PBP1A family penicillin-binding protein [Sphingomonas ginkgonis]